MTSQLVVRHRQAKLRTLVLFAVRFTVRASRLKVTEQVVTEPNISFKRTFIWMEGLGILVDSNVLVITPQIEQSIAEKAIGIDVQWVQHYRSTEGREAEVGATHGNRKFAIVSQHPCIAGCKRQRTLELFNRPSEIQRSREIGGERQVTLSKIRGQSDGLACVRLRFIEATSAVGSSWRIVVPGKIH